MLVSIIERKRRGDDGRGILRATVQRIGHGFAACRRHRVASQEQGVGDMNTLIDLIEGAVIGISLTAIVIATWAVQVLIGV